MNLFVVFVLFLCSVAFAHVEKMPDVQDNRDGRVYKTVQIGEQRWMAENLRYNVRGSVCYEKKDFNCEKYGRLYNWAMAMMLVDYYNSHSIQKLVGKYKKGKIHDICPTGWHLPSNKEWKKLKFFVAKKGVSDGVALSLKSTESWEKELRIPGGTDEFGFSALPGGERDFEGRFFDLGRSAVFWTSTEYDDGGARNWWIYYDSRSMEGNYDTKETGASVRCVEDRLYEIKEPPPPVPKVEPKVVEIQGRKTQTVHIGDQVWMANNLDVKVPGSYCYANKEENCQKYGRLYTWAGVVKLDQKFNQSVGKDSISKRKPKGICPNGWHVPTSLDFARLNAYLKDIDEAVGVGTNLRSRTGWDESEDALMGENGFGFNGEAFGVCKYTKPKETCVSVIKAILPDPTKKSPADTVYADSCVVDPTWVPSLAFEGNGTLTGFWSGTEVDSLRAEVRKLSFDDDDFILDTARKDEAYYLRCIMDPPDDDELYDSTAFVDKRDENKYRTVAVGSTIWMSENLRFAAPGSYCYEDKDSRCRSYGRLYPWSVAMRLPADYVDNSMSGGITQEHQGICPDGWHIPTNEEWIELGQFALSKRKGGVGAALKNREFWARGGAPISAASGFNALPSGSRMSDSEYMELGSSTYFWTAAGGDGLGAVYWYLVNNRDDFTSAEDFDNAAFSLRCVKNKLTKAAAPAATAAP
ncbi:MAG: FISUMP domain-containing protein [Fibrobacter sp.]|nr:FISUMP domain-containing protein [Fibrobacter sp.]